MKTFLEAEAQLQCLLVISDLHCQTPTLTLERTMLQRRGREQHLRSLGQKCPTLLQHICPYQRPHQNLRMMHPYIQNQSVRALHGMAQAKCQVTYLRTENGCSHQIICTMAKRTNQKINLKLQPMSQAPSLRLKKKNLRQVSNPQKNVVGDQVAPFANLKNRRKSKARCSCKHYHLKQSSKLQDQKQWEEEIERLNSKYNLDCYSDSELDSESDEGEQYHYEHGYETLI